MKNVSDRILLMAEAKPRQLNMRSEGLFFLGRGQYTIFLHSRPERESQLSFSAAARKFVLSGRSAKISIFLDRVRINFFLR